MPTFAIDEEQIMEELLMSTKTKCSEEELELELQTVENYSPEVETSIWYN